MIPCVLVHCHTPGIIFLNLLKMRSRKMRWSGWLRLQHRSADTPLVSAGFPCSGAALPAVEIRVSGGRPWHLLSLAWGDVDNSMCFGDAAAKLQSTSQQAKKGSCKGCLESKWADGTTGAKTCKTFLVFQIQLQIPGKFVGFWHYLWGVCCWHKWILGFKPVKTQLQDPSCLSGCRDLLVSTVTLVEAYVNGELMSWFIFKTPFFLHPPRFLLQFWCRQEDLHCSFQLCGSFMPAIDQFLPELQ